MNRRGVVLLLVLLALATLGATGVAVLAAAHAARDDARGTLASLHARSLAGASAARAWSEWDGAARAGDAIGTVAEWLASSTGAIATMQRTRLHPQLWWIAADARAMVTLRAKPVRHAAVLALHLAVSPVAPLAALTTAGAVTIGTGTAVGGGDSVPNSWPCAREVAPEVAIHRASASPLVAPTALVRGAELRFAVGAPDDPRRAWESARPTIIATASVRPLAGANLLISPRDSLGSCPPGATVWGEPDRSPAGVAACRRLWVVVHAAGPLTLSGGRGQGVLVADGGLRLTGTATFVGLVIARGRVLLEDRSRLIGALVVADAPGDPASAVTLTGSASITRSRCAVLAALVGGPLLAPAAPGGWLTLW